MNKMVSNHEGLTVVNCILFGRSNYKYRSTLNIPKMEIVVSVVTNCGQARKDSKRKQTSLDWRISVL